MSTQKVVMNGVHDSHSKEGASVTSAEQNEHQRKLDATQGLMAAIAYGSCSVGMAFANKALLNTYNFSYQFTLIFTQMVFTAVVLEVIRHLNMVSLPRYTLERGYKFLWPSLFYACHSVLSLSALGGMNIPMYGVIKRCAPITTLLLGSLVLGKGLPSARICVAVVMITMGCIIAGYGDLAFNLEAYTCGIASVVTQAIYLLLVQKGSKNQSAIEILQLNAINTIPPLIVMSVALGEITPALGRLRTTDIGFLLNFFLVISMGCLLNYLLFLCTTLNSALTTSVVGTLKSILQTAIGMFTFGGISINLFTMSGLSLNLFGGIMYSYSKYVDTQAKLKAAEKTKQLNGV